MGLRFHETWYSDMGRFVGSQQDGQKRDVKNEVLLGLAIVCHGRQWSEYQALGVIVCEVSTCLQCGGPHWACIHVVCTGGLRRGAHAYVSREPGNFSSR